jgi:hypothetical protein
MLTDAEALGLARRMLKTGAEIKEWLNKGPEGDGGWDGPGPMGGKTTGL